jgi:hypothetical protein
LFTLSQAVYGINRHLWILKNENELTKIDEFNICWCEATPKVGLVIETSGTKLPGMAAIANSKKFWLFSKLRVIKKLFLRKDECFFFFFFTSTVPDDF